MDQGGRGQTYTIRNLASAETETDDREFKAPTLEEIGGEGVRVRVRHVCSKLCVQLKAERVEGRELLSSERRLAAAQHSRDC